MLLRIFAKLATVPFIREKLRRAADYVKATEAIEDPVQLGGMLFMDSFDTERTRRKTEELWDAPPMAGGR